MKICLAQLSVGSEVAPNEARIAAAIDSAAAEGADLLLTPEGSLSGYTPRFDEAAVEAALERLRTRAAQASVGLALGSCYVESDGECRNELRFYDRAGRFLGYHSKILRCASWDEEGRGELYDYATSPLRTFDFHGTVVGGLICNDLWANPGCTTLADDHLSQRLSLLGAKIILHAVNGGRDRSEFSTRVARNFHESNLLMRARSGRLYIATVDNCSPVGDPTSSPGGIVAPSGEWLHRLPPAGEAVRTFEIEV